MHFHYIRKYTRTLQLAIFDWAGTTVDYGCQAPVSAFIQGFKSLDITLTPAMARGPMGMEKKEHIRRIFLEEEIQQQWWKRYRKEATTDDIDRIYRSFTSSLLRCIAEQSRLIPQVNETIQNLKRRGMRIGASTGYFKEAADRVVQRAGKEGFTPDCTICASDVPVGRPWPWMIFRLMEQLEICPPEAVVNIGDTVVDVESGLNAGVWSVGVAATGNQMGLAQDEAERMPEERYKQKLFHAHQTLLQAGAHYVVDSIAQIPSVVEKINHRLAEGDKP